MGEYIDIFFMCQETDEKPSAVRNVMSDAAPLTSRYYNDSQLLHLIRIKMPTEFSTNIRHLIKTLSFFNFLS